MILDELARSTRKRVEKSKLEAPEVVEQALSIKKEKPFYLEEKLREPGISFICEVKRASPSKGLIAPDFPYLDIARDYEKAGADAISVLTEPEYFMGSNRYLSEIRKEVSIPILRKDFTVDEYQIYEALTIGADAVLLICALLDTETLKRYIAVADKLGLSCIVEAHDENEVKSALSAGARIVGVNNRNLKDFTVDITNSARLRKLVPSDIIFISESGIKTRDDVKKLEDENVNAVLIGETFMRSPDKAAMLRELRGL
ncbi:MAG: indole-3-glycerol phosphate synthase TrpC [Oscillospiraceae bacterium]|nr:indole-3-glycerol phosphate synthase TrpC [Oscillospiraceae bacterium]